MRRAHITHRRLLYITARRRFILATTAMRHAIITIGIIRTTEVMEAMGISMVMDTEDMAVDIEAIVDC